MIRAPHLLLFLVEGDIGGLCLNPMASHKLTLLTIIIIVNLIGFESSDYVCIYLQAHA